MNRSPSFLQSGLSLCFLFVTISALDAAPTPAPSYALCARWQRQGYYTPAVKCYLREAKKIRLTPSTPESQRLLKGYFYREASRSLLKRAAKAERAEQAAYLRERAVSLLERILQKKLVPKVHGRRPGRVIHTEIRKNPLPHSVYVAGCFHRRSPNLHSNQRLSL